MKIKKMFNEWISITNNYINKLEYEFSQIYRNYQKFIHRNFKIYKELSEI